MPSDVDLLGTSPVALIGPKSSANNILSRQPLTAL
jgi:hypothetical protein